MFCHQVILQFLIAAISLLLIEKKLKPAQTA